MNPVLDIISFIKLRDCFYGGYSMPQYCIDNNISFPIIVSAQPEFLWEIFVQFKYDKRVNADFCLINGNEEYNISFSVAGVLDRIPLKNFEYNELNKHDKIIMLTTSRIEQFKDKTIYIDALLDRFITHVYAEIPLKNYLDNNEGVKIIVNNHPYLNLGTPLSDYEKKIISSGSIHDLRNKLKSRGQVTINTRYDMFGYSNQDVYDLLEMSGAKTNADGSTSLLDNDNPLINIKNGKRATAYQPTNYKNTIYFLGTCTFFGIGAPFDKTIESYLQKLLNDNGYNYKVENASQFYAGRYQDIFYNLNALPVKSGDIICIFIQDLQPQNFPFLNIRNIFNRPHNYGEVFADEAHLNERGYKIIADVYYNVLVQNSFLTKYNHDNSKVNITAHSYGIPNLLSIKDSEEWNFNFDVKLKQKLNDYKVMLRKNRLNIGCIVMNCNPFTLGHRYLIEYASSKVEMLYIFVVEEDKSEFTFEERLRLVKKGVEDIPNVKVLPSGKFIISQLTFSGYFNKSKLQSKRLTTKVESFQAT